MAQKLTHSAAYYFSLIQDFPRLCLILPVVLCGFLASGLVFLEENNDGRIFFDPESPARQQLRLLEQNFTESNSLLIALSPAKGDVFTPDFLKVLHKITSRAWQVPHVIRVNSLSNYQHIDSKNDELIIEDLIRPEIFDDPETISQKIKDIRDYALAENDLVGQIISPNGRVVALVLSLSAPRGDSRVIQDIMTAVYRLKAEIRAENPEIAVYITGDVPLDYAFSEAYAFDLSTLFPIFLGIVFLTCGLFFRSFRLSGVILGMMGLLVTATLGAAGYLNIPITAGTAAVPVILITIALADFVHLLTTLRLEMRRGLSRSAALTEAIKYNFLPISLTSLTTLIGFISLNASEAPPFRDMGNLVAIAIFLSYLMTFSVFPVILGHIKLDRKFSASHPGILSVTGGLSLDLVTRFSRGLIRLRQWVIVVFILLSMALAGGLYQIEFDDDWVLYFGPDNNFRQDTTFVVQHLSGVDTIDYQIASDGPGGVTAPEFLGRLSAFENWARGLPEISHVAAIPALFKKMNQHMNGGAEVIANDAALNAQYLLMYEMSLPVGLDLNDRIDIQKQITRLTITARDLTARQMRDLNARLSEKLQAMGLIRAGESGVGVPLMFAQLSKSNIQAMLGGIALALGLVSGIICLTFRSLWLGLLSFLVNVLPIILGFGLWGWIYRDVGVSLTVVAAIAFGIVVDDSIHFISKYNASAKKHNTPEARLAMTYRSVGGALLMTSVILMMGFSVLAFSAFQPTWGLGLISALMIFLAIFYDFLLLPLLLVGKIKSLP